VDHTLSILGGREREWGGRGVVREKENHFFLPVFPMQCSFVLLVEVILRKGKVLGSEKVKF
jgi:hypothetical protein